MYLDDAARVRVTEDLETTFLVEAGAGTGKTTVLLQRLLALVRSGRDRLERLATITFTEKAAAELRMRLRADVETALLGPLSDKERDNLREARIHLERAQISTIHAFCAALLRERPVEAGVDPQFTLLDDFGARLLQAEAWRTWLAEEMDSCPPALKGALRAGLTLAHVEQLRDFVVEQRDNLHLLPPAEESPAAALRTTLTQAIARLYTLRASCTNDGDRALAQIDALAALLPLQEDDTAWERLLTRDLPIRSRAGAKGHWRNGTLESVRAIFQQIDTAYHEARAAWCHNLTIALVRWLSGFIYAYAEQKRKRGVLDFNDLLLCARNVLKENLDVRGYFQARFNYLLVDEFQDTDPLQTEIVFFLAEREPRAAEWTAVAMQPGKLFAVGDPQQSIYRFRRADLHVYVQARAAIARQGALLSLSTNFRSSPAALNWVNKTFTRLLADAGADQPPYQPLHAAREDDNSHGVIVVPIPGALLSEKSPRAQVRQAEAGTVATFLHHAVEDDSAQVWGDQAVHYRDIAILFRTHQAMEAYEEALQNADIPYRVFGGRRYVSRPEIEDLRVLLRVMESPSDAAALVAVLRSSLFGFSDAELAVFSGAGGRFDYTAPLPSRLPAVHHFSAAFALLNNLHTKRTQHSPAALLYTIYTETHLLPLFAVRPQGMQRVANLLKLLDTARNLASQGIYTLTALNRFLAQQEEATVEGEPFIAEDHEDVVRLLTIHKAKGLEFPVVVLADSAPNRGHSGRLGIVNRFAGNLEVRVGPRNLNYATLGWQQTETHEQEQETAEEKRLWYVAATRARDHLVIPVAPRHASAPSFLVGDEWEDEGKGLLAKEHIFVYNIDARTVERAAPRLPAAPSFIDIAANQAARAAHEQWQAGRQRELLEAGRPGAVSAVTTLAEAALPGKTRSVRDETNGLGSRSTALRLGKAVHEALRTINIGATTQSPLLSGQAVGLLHSPVEREEAERLVHNILASSVMGRARGARERFAELPFVLHTGERILEGVIDLAFIEDGNWIIVDFKTDTVDTADIEERALQYRPQLDLYALALERLTARSVKEMLVLFARSQRSVCFAWDDRARARAAALW